MKFGGGSGMGKMSGMGMGKVKASPKPKMGGAGHMMKVHPAAQARVRVPQGIDNTGPAAPPPWLPGVGKV
jgi:hypothetical protein